MTDPPWRRGPALVSAALALAILGACSSPAAVSPTAAPPKPTGAAAAAFDPASIKNAADLNEALKPQTPEARAKILLDGAQREGGFMLYSTMSADNSQKLMDAFNKAYPFTKADVFRATDGDLMNKAMTEFRAKKTLFDVIDVSVESILTYEEAGVVTPYDSPSLAGLNENARDPQHFYNFMYLNGVVPAWNTQHVKPEDVPKSYDDFLLPRWKDKIAIDSEDYAWAYFLKQTMGDAKATEFLQKLSAQNPRVLHGRVNQLNLLEAGDFDLSVALFDYMLIVDKNKGAPIDWKYLRPTMVSGEPLFLNKTPPHPYSALLFIDWLFSKDGMQVFATATGRMIPRADVTMLNAEILDQNKGEVWMQGPDSGKNLTQQEKDFSALFKLT